MKLNSTNFNSDWNNKTLSELGTFARGKSRHRPRNDPVLYAGGCHPLIQTGDITQATFRITSHSATYNDMGLAQSKLWPEGTLCITIAANIAETALLGYPMCFPDSVVGFSADPDETSEVFMHYVFTYIRKAIQNSVTGSIQDNINIEYLTNLRFKIPSPDEQDKIASVLSTLDAKIDLNSRINAELEALAKTIYDYWFVQFDFPDANGCPHKSSGGAMVWNDTLKRAIPAGWDTRSLWSIATYTNGLAMQKFRPKSENYLPVIKIREMSEGFTADTERASPSISSKCIVDDGDVLFSWSATLAVQIWTQGRGALNQHIFKVTSEIYPKSFFYFELLNYLDHFKMMAEKRKTTMGHITLDHLRQSVIVTPPLPLIEKLDVFLRPIFGQCIGLSKQNLELTQLRDWLLPMLMNGQVRVA